MNDRSKLLATVRQTLLEAGFNVSELCVMRPTGFDLVARKDDKLLIIKVLSNIDALSEEVSKELQVLSHLLRGHPLLIGEKSGAKQLEDDIVYFRFGVQSITPQTLYDHFVEETPIRKFSAPGGLYVSVDSDKIRHLREEKSVSLGAFARHVKVSRRTAQMYEEGMDARMDTARRMEDILGEPIIVPIDLFQSSSDMNKKMFDLYEQTLDSLRMFQKGVLTHLKDIGYRVTPFGKCPFEAVSGKKNITFLTCVHSFNRTLIKKARHMSSISDVMEKQAALFTDKETSKKNVEGTPLILKKELEKLSDPREVYDLIVERT